MITMTEKKFEKDVKAFLKAQGCWYVKTWSNGVQRKGIPDLLVCCNGVFLGVELKCEEGHPSDLQLWNIKKIRMAHGIGIVLYPEAFIDFQEMIKEIKLDEDNGFDWYCKQHTYFDREGMWKNESL